MNISDFNYMWRGKSIRELSTRDAHLLAPIEIKKHDSGRAILLLHGFSSSPAIYRELIPALRAYDMIYCPVLPGHAVSVDEFARCRAEEWVDCAYKSYDYLARNYAEVDVLGLSMGGLLAAKVAEKYTLHHLYLLAPALELLGLTSLRLFSAQILKFLGLKKIRNQGGNFYTDSNQEITFKQLPVSAIIAILSLVKNNKIIKPSCNTDLFLGRFDEVVDSHAVEKLYSGFKNTNIHWLNNSAHILSLDGDVEEIISCINKNAASNR
jgi:carboxylesterase